MEYKTEYKTVTLPEVSDTIEEYKLNGYIYCGSSTAQYTATLKFEKPVIPTKSIDKFKVINEKLEDYYNQQKNNEFFSEQGKRLVCRVIENCQKIVNEVEESDE